MRKLQGRLFYVVATISATAGIAAVLAAGATPGPATAAATGVTGTTGATGPRQPAVTTRPASNVRTDSAVLNGTVNPEGQATSYYFQYGTSTAYGLQTSPANAGSGTSSVGVHASVTGLAPNTTYHYRLVAQGASGTSYGSDATVTPGERQSQVRFIGREGFVSPGRVIGVEAGCFGGDTPCVGHVTMSHNGIVIGQRDFSIAPDSGGFQNLEITLQGEQMLVAYNRVFHLLPVTVTVKTASGQQTSQVMHLARWIWH